MPDAVDPAFARLLDAIGDPRAAPDLAWVAALTGASPRAVRAAMAELIAFAPMERQLRATLAGGGRDYYAQIRAPMELYALTRLVRPGHVVEVGVSSGVSSAHFLLGLRQNREGSLHSIDLPMRQRGVRLADGESEVSLPPRRSSGWAVPPDLRGGWDLNLGPSQRLLPELVARIPRIDLFLHDDLHTPEHLAFELRTIAPRLRPGSVVLADNTEWTGSAFPEFAERIGATVLAKGDSDLLGLRVPLRPPPAARPGRAPGAR